MNKTAKKTLDCFVEKFSASPHLYFSPGRINLIGEHVDYNDGFVMPAAIDRGVYYAVAANNSDTINIFSLDYGEQVSIPLNEVRKMEGWKNYVLSVVNQFQLLKKNISGFDAVFGGDVPIGAGMSSSAAVEGGLAFALNEIFNCGIDRVELAKLCQRAEHGYPGVNCGIMDQFANMMGKKDQVILLDCQDLSYQYFPLRPDGYKIVLLNTKVHHSLGSGEYNSRRKDCEEGLMIMHSDSAVRSFRDVRKPENLLAYIPVMGEQVYRRCLYVIDEIRRTQLAAKCLQENDIVGFGKLMFETHEGLRSLYDVSCEELDFLVDEAKQYPPVVGARLMGGGFGGCTINLVKEEGINSFVEKAGADYQEKFGIEIEIYEVNTSDGVGKIES
ncbi:MAG TPA: galactokinase [Ferruginibacter sp.]|nr:galactokinase [Ferruginibacter sp.]